MHEAGTQDDYIDCEACVDVLSLILQTLLVASWLQLKSC